MKAGILKLLLFVALMGGFYAFDGFERPVLNKNDYRASYRGNAKMARAWVATVAMFVAGPCWRCGEIRSRNRWIGIFRQGCIRSLG